MELQLMKKSKFFCLIMASLMVLSMSVGVGTSVYASEETIDESIVEKIENFEIDTVSENYATNLNDLSDSELEKFKENVSAEVDKLDLSTEEEKEAYYNSLLDLFDPESETYGDLEYASEKLGKELNPAGRYKRAAHGWISVGFAGAAFNLGVNLVTGGVASAGVKALIRKFGTQKAIDLINRRIVGIIATWGIKQATGINIITGAVASAIKTALDPGTAIAKFIDARDKIRNNGYLEFT